MADFLTPQRAGPDQPLSRFGGQGLFYFGGQNMLAPMRVTITLRSADGAVIVSNTIAISDPRRLSGTISQAAWAAYGDASHKGFSPIGTTLTVTEEDEAGETLARRAARMVAAVRRGRVRR